MMARLDNQRPPRKAHTRSNGRKYQRGYDTLPHDVWGTSVEINPL